MLWATEAVAQNRGLYPLGMSTLNSGSTPEPGFTYANQLLFYSRDSAKDASGNTAVTGSQAVLMDLNTLAWVSGRSLLGGARYSASITIPFAKNQLTSDIHGPVSGGGGLADSFYMPFILGWNKESYAVKAIYGVLAPTGAFVSGGSENVGSGYWTSTISSGQTIYPTKSKQLALSAYEMYEVHTTQEGTATKPGDTFDLDYSAYQTLPAGGDSWRLQIGLVGYEARQATARTGPSITEAESRERYLVNAIGAGVNFAVPRKGFSIGARFFDEFANRSTFQGFSMQFSGAIAF